MNDAGITVIEVLVAALLIGIALVPLMQLFPGVLAADEEAEHEMRLGAAGVRKIEEIIGRLRSDITAVGSGSDSCADVPQCRLEWTVATEATSLTSGAGVLKRIGILACADANGSLICDPGETQVRFEAKVTSRP